MAGRREGDRGARRRSGVESHSITEPFVAATVRSMATAVRYLLAALMVGMGVLHFVAPKAFIRTMPKALPAHGALVAISGAFEVLGGVGLLIPLTQKWAAWGLIALFVAVFPANVNMAVHGISFGRGPTPRWVLWARLPLQAVFIYWAWTYTR
jgi:uncharacterized membrane protein